MKKITRQKWLNALRSNRFKQGRGSLRQQGEKGPLHCCLGVLCEITGKGNAPYLVGGYGYPGNMWTNGAPIMAYAGLNETEQAVLADKNDNGVSFNEIADWIEENIKED